MSAVERLEQLTDWQTSHSDIWSIIRRGELTCGLATANIAKPGGAGIQAIETSEGFTLSGTAPWVCGVGLFGVLLVGFQTKEAVVFDLMDSPNTHVDKTLEATPQKLVCMNGTGSSRLKFNEHKVPHSAVISSKIRTGPARLVHQNI